MAPRDDPAAKALELLGDRWSLLVVREAVEGRNRFGQIQRSLGIARTVLSQRLQRLVHAEIIERHRYHENPDWYEYRATRRGRDLYPAITELTRWARMHLP